MFFYKIMLKSFDDERSEFFIIPDQTNEDEKGVPFIEKTLTNSSEYKAFVKKTKTDIVDVSYKVFSTKESLGKGIDETRFNELSAKGLLTETESNEISISAKKSMWTYFKEHSTVILIASGAILLLLIVIIALAVALTSAGNAAPPPVIAETTAVTETTTTPEETKVPETEETTEETEEIPDIPDEDEDTDIDTTIPPDEETDEDGYTDSGYSTTSSSSGSYSSSSGGGTYTISFSANGGTGTIEGISSAAGQYVTLPSAAEASKYMSKTGYKLIGFSDNTDILYPLYSYKMPNNNVTLFAVWERDTFIVEYNSNGGTGQLSRAEVKFGDNVPLPVDIPIYNGDLYLSGWSKDRKAETALKNLAMPAENLTLYAVWSEKPPTAKITLHYDDKVQVIEKEIGTTVDMLDDFGIIKDGEIVSGWYFENSPKRIENLYIDGDCDVYAQWAKAKYISVTLDRSYLNIEPEEYSVPLDMTGTAKLVLPAVDDKEDIYNHVEGCTYGYATKPQKGDYAVIEYYGGEESKFTRDTTLYRVLGEYGGGAGTAENPYIINYYDQLIRLSEQGAKGYYIQTADITFPANIERKPIDTRKIGRGYENKSYDFFVYDGQDYTIKNLSGEGGLFGKLAASTIKNVNIDGAVVYAGEYKNVGILCNEVTSYSFPAIEGTDVFGTGNSKILNCKVGGCKIYANKAENVGGIIGYGGAVSFCYVDGIEISGGNNVGGIVGNACTVTGSMANAISTSGNVSSAGGIAGTAYGVPIYDGEKPHYSGGSIIGCGVRTFSSSAKSCGGIVGTATAHKSTAYIKSCYAANIYLNGKYNGGIAGSDGKGKPHGILYCIVDNTNKYPVIGGDKPRSVSKTMVLSVPADSGLTVDGVLSVLNAKSSGFDGWERNKDTNGGYPYPSKIFNNGGKKNEKTH